MKNRVDLDNVPLMQAEAHSLDYWDFVRLEFFIGSPHKTNFRVDLSEDDLEELISALQDTKQEKFGDDSGLNSGVEGEEK